MKNPGLGLSVRVSVRIDHIKLTTPHHTPHRTMGFGAIFSFASWIYITLLVICTFSPPPLSSYSPQASVVLFSYIPRNQLFTHFFFDKRSHVFSPSSFCFFLPFINFFPTLTVCNTIMRTQAQPHTLTRAGSIQQHHSKACATVKIQRVQNMVCKVLFSKWLASESV